ncbi:MAG TPA: PD-(D/E)XK nuclease domain-containing protein [Leptospiraceae bacterium]|nr:PD-(D/E)XK nuclease domain-containing protein [Leptospiraceae bacterium]HNI94883.1 PD-(D/E)XK nuclease domain-containing protein [Leptospiraceae bacterium]
MIYTLDYPNFEVKNAFLAHFAQLWTNKEAFNSYIHKLIQSLHGHDFESFFTILRSIFANIDYDLHIAQEKYYQTVFYLIFTLIGLRVSAEVKTNIGRIDAVIEDKDVFLFEFKFNGTKEEALEQIRKHKYFEKYLAGGLKQSTAATRAEKIYLLGVEFKDKNVGDWTVSE